MSDEIKAVDATDLPDLLNLAEDVRATGVPRVIKRASEALAVLVPITTIAVGQYDESGVPKSRRMKAQLMAVAGAWSDLDADALIEHI